MGEMNSTELVWTSHATNTDLNDNDHKSWSQSGSVSRVATVEMHSLQQKNSETYKQAVETQLIETGLERMQMLDLVEKTSERLS